jgi:hypothetical protein
MNVSFTALMVFGCLVGSVLIGITIRGLLPQAHLSSETKDAVKVAMGLVATMSALVLGLLVSSAKGSYDTKRTEVIQMAAKVAFLDRVLIAYGPEAAGVRVQLRDMVEQANQKMWPGAMRQPTDRNPNIQEGNLVYAALQHLSPHDECSSCLEIARYSTGRRTRSG